MEDSRNMHTSLWLNWNHRLGKAVNWCSKSIDKEALEFVGKDVSGIIYASPLLTCLRYLKIYSCFHLYIIQHPGPLSFPHVVTVSRCDNCFPLGFPSGLHLSWRLEGKQGTPAETFPKVNKWKDYLLSYTCTLSYKFLYGICLLLPYVQCCWIMFNYDLLLHPECFLLLGQLFPILH